jgi:hypothetical protein
MHFLCRKLRCYWLLDIQAVDQKSTSFILSRRHAPWQQAHQGGEHIARRTSWEAHRVVHKAGGYRKARIKRPLRDVNTGNQ